MYGVVAAVTVAMGIGSGDGNGGTGGIGKEGDGKNRVTQRYELLDVRHLHPPSIRASYSHTTCQDLLDRQPKIFV